MLGILNINDELVAALDNDGSAAAPYWDDEIHEKLNDAYITLSFKMPADHPDSEYVVNGNKVILTDKDEDLQAFEIKTVEDIQGTKGERVKEVYAEHIALELNGKIVRPDTYSGVSASQFLDLILQGTRWKVGIVEWLGIETFEIEDYKSGIQAIILGASQFEGEFKFRVEVDNGKLKNLYVDLLQRRGKDSGVQILYGHNQKSLKRFEDSSEVYTALIGVAKGSEGGFLTFEDVYAPDKPIGQDWIGDDAALEKYGILMPNGERQHYMGVYTYGGSNDDLTADQLLTYTRSQLTKVSKPKFTYEAEVFDLEFVAANGLVSDYSHEKMRLGDTLGINNTDFEPDILVSARVIEHKWSKSDKTKGSVVLGDYRNIFDQNIFNQIQSLRNTIIKNAGYWEKTTPVIRSTLAPTDTSAIWIDTSTVPNVIKTFNPDSGLWEKASPENVADIGGLTSEEVEALSQQVTEKYAEKLWHVGNTPPADTTRKWVDTSKVPNVVKVYKDGAWIIAAPTEPEHVKAEPDMHVGTTAPADTSRKWMDTSKNPAVLKAFVNGAWVKATPTEAAEVGAETPEGAQQKAEAEAAAAKQEAINAAAADATSKADAAKQAAIDAANAETVLAEERAKAYADGVVDDEEAARIAQAEANLAAAKADATSKANAAETAAKNHADLVAEQKKQEAIAAAELDATEKANAAQAAAEAVARSEADLAEANAEAYADGIVSDEEAARIKQAQDNLNAAKADASQKAADAEAAAKAHADLVAQTAEENAKEYAEPDIHVGPSAPADTTRKWIDTSKQPHVVKYYNPDTNQWVTAAPTLPGHVNAETLIHVGTSPPADSNRKWIDISKSPFLLKTYQGGVWKAASPTDLADLTGKILGTQITDGSIKTPHISANGLDAEVIKTGILDADLVQIIAAAGGVVIDERGIFIRNGLIQIEGGLPPEQIDLSIGGRNLLRDSYLRNWGVSSTSTASKTETPIDQGNAVRADSTGSGTNFGLLGLNPDRKARYELGKTYTISFYARGNVSALDYTYFMRNDGANSVVTDMPNVTLSETEWVKIVAHEEALWTTDEGYLLIGSRDVGAGKWFEIKMVKVEEGNIDTDWTPAPEDVDQELKRVGTYIDDTGVYTGIMSWNQGYGGTLQLGGIDNQNGELTVLDSNGDPKIRLGNDNAGFGEISVDYLREARNVITQTTESDIYFNADRRYYEVFVDGDFGSDTTGDGTRDNPFETINMALTVIPRFLNNDCEILIAPCSKPYNENVYVQGFKGEGVLRLRSYLKDVRYIRDWSYGSSSNSGNHWVSIRAVDLASQDVARGKTVTTNGTPNSSYPLSRITNGNTSSSDYADAGFGNVYVQIDLGSATDLYYIDVIKYWSDGRAYKSVKTEVSTDGVTWRTIWDNSKMGGNYYEIGEYKHRTAYINGYISCTSVDRIEFHLLHVDSRSQKREAFRIFNCSASQLYRVIGLCSTSTDTYYVFYIYGSYCRIQECETDGGYSAGIIAAYGASVDLFNGNWGGDTPYGVYGYSASTVGGSGTIPWGDTGVSRTSQGGTVTGGWNDGSKKKGFYSTPIVAQPEPPPPPPPQPVTKTWTSTYSESWRPDYGGQWSGGSTGRDVIQGEWAGWGIYEGYWFFGDDIRATVAGKSISKIRIYTTRNNSGGISGSVPVYFRAHQYSSKSAAGSSPTYYGSGYGSASFKWGEGKWVTLPSSFHTYFSSNSARGIMIYINSSSDGYYARMSGVAKIEITYTP